jgi:sec-independent protein translocase protein TatA
MLGNLTGVHLLIILGVLVLLFGAAKLPALAKAIGQSSRILKNELKGDADARAEHTQNEPVIPGDSQPKS